MNQPSPIQKIDTDCNGHSPRSVVTKEGIKAARARGVEWGSAGKVRAAANRNEANAFAESMRLMVLCLLLYHWKKSGVSRWLNKAGIPSQRGGQWHGATVGRLIERLGPTFQEDIIKARQLIKGDKTVFPSLIVGLDTIRVGNVEGGEAILCDCLSSKS